MWTIEIQVLFLRIICYQPLSSICIVTVSKFFKDLIFVDDKLRVKTAKITSLKNLYGYGNLGTIFVAKLCTYQCKAPLHFSQALLGICTIENAKYPPLRQFFCIICNFTRLVTFCISLKNVQLKNSHLWGAEFQ